MDPITVTVATGLFDVARNLINKLVQDPAANAEMQLKLMELDANNELAMLQQQMAAIVAEANSSDPWTSRARPSFMYLFYAIVIFMVVVAPLVGVFFPDKMDLLFMNVNKGFSAIPEPMWWTFTAGFLGYSGSKSLEAIKGVKRPGQ